MLKVYIKDKENGAQVERVSIHLNSRETISDRLAYFLVGSDTPDEYAVELSYVGYATEILRMEIPENKTVEVNVNIRRSSLNLQKVAVSGKTPAQNNSIADIDILLRPANTSQDILKMVPGLFIAQHAGGGKTEQIFLRGYDLDHGTDISITVDSMPVNMVSHAHGQGYADQHLFQKYILRQPSFRSHRTSGACVKL